MKCLSTRNITAVLLVCLICWRGYSSSTASLQITAHVPKVIGLIAEAPYEPVYVDFHQENQSQRVIGIIKEIRSSHTGYFITLTSENAAASSSSTAILANCNGHEIPYSISYGDIEVEFDQGSSLVANHAGHAIGVMVSQEVRLMGISHVSTPQLGTYTDMLIFTISAN